MKQILRKTCWKHGGYEGIDCPHCLAEEQKPKLLKQSPMTPTEDQRSIAQIQARLNDIESRIRLEPNKGWKGLKDLLEEWNSESQKLANALWWQAKQQELSQETDYHVT